MEIFEISIVIRQCARELLSAHGEERFQLLLNVARDAQKLLEECLNAAVDMDLSTEHNIEAHNIARAGACFDPLQGRFARQKRDT